MISRRPDDDAAAHDGPRRSSLWGSVLPDAFFARDVVTVARALLGTVLVHETPDGVLAGHVVETEAYAGRDDPASHAFRGERPHLTHLFGPPATIYVYRSYGLHWCANVVTAPLGHGSAVLLRAVEPLLGVSVMRRRRGDVTDRVLTNGPGKLCQALGIDRSHDGARWTTGALRLHAGLAVEEREIAASRRIGITRNADALLRFTLPGSPALARPGLPPLRRRESLPR